MANQSPPPNDYCGTLPEAASPPVVNFFGGLKLVAQVDPTKGAPGQCELSLDLIGKMEAALAPLAPMLIILDVVAQLVTCFQLATDAISNPLKVPDLLACLPDLVTKFNQLLGLIPSFPQGIVNIVGMVYSTIQLVSYQIGCLINVVESIQAQLAEVNDLLSRAQSASDGRVRANLEALAECAKQNAKRQADSALAALGPLARILCTVRTLLALIPGEGRSLAKKISLQVPTSLDDVDAALAALQAVKTSLDEVLVLIEALAAPFGGLPQQDAEFRCPIDDLPDEEEEVEEPAQPTVTAVFPVSGTLVAPVPADVQLQITGTGFAENAQAYVGTTAIGTQRVNATLVIATVPKALFQTAATYSLIVVNAAPAGGTRTINNGSASTVPAQSFGGLPDPATGASTALSKASEPFDYTVL